MDVTPLSSNPAEAGAAKAVSQLSASLVQTAASHRALVQEMTEFAKDESLRFANLRLERNGAALDKLQTCAGLPGLIGVQQEWLRDFLQDYAGQNLRFAGAFRGLAQHVAASAAEAGEMAHQAAETGVDAMDHMQQDASDLVHRNGEQTGQMAQDAGNYVQEPLH